MADAVIISVATTGSVPRKRDNPALPVTVAEQIESTHAAYEAGAALVHVHVRNADETRPVATARQARAVLGLA
jgi:uncharacterized protein (DUF849 family)